MDATERDRAYRTAVAERYPHFDISAYAACAIEVARAAEAARRPDPSGKVTVKPAVTRANGKRIAVDANGIPIDEQVTPALRLSRKFGHR